MSFVVGTAGHIDHGKTALVQLLTGQDTDRLQAEKDRGISIDLGFAYFTLPDGTPVGVVDVPGHERFIRNMVAGVHGIKLVLFVIAADDGVMPQTEEHFDILCALGVKQAIFVVTKMDIVDEARFAEVRDEIAILVDDSAFEGATVLPLSNVTGAGIDDLLAEMTNLLTQKRAQYNKGVFRMPVDRVFIIHGRGVVVTGTLRSGTVAVGDEISLVPGGHLFRVRGLQKHSIDIERGYGGDRIAINLTGAKRHMIARGDVACDPAIAATSDRFDVKLSVVRHATCDLKHGQRLRLHIGAAERFGSVKLLRPRQSIKRGQNGLAQIVLTELVHVMAGDRFVIRDEQAEHTLGGGTVLDPIAPRVRRGDKTHAEYLAELAKGHLIRGIELLIDGTSALGVPAAEVMFRMSMSQQEIEAGVDASESLIQLATGPDIWLTSMSNLDTLNQKIHSTLDQFHNSQPTVFGLGIDALYDQIAGNTNIRLFRAIVDRAVDADHLTREGAVLALPSHQVSLTPVQQAMAGAFLKKLEENPFTPPAVDPNSKEEIIVAAYLEQKGQLVRVAADMVFATSAFETANQKLEAHLLEYGDISAAQFRDLLGTTRKYALALLEVFDRSGRTIRIGDIRKRGKPLSVKT